ncbi:TPA: sulfatase-like hydrolase/transferase [Kluyvera ascorbata]|nr:sulfatase-like hydrolase/transferase [Kluyvera ascorbata]
MVMENDSWSFLSIILYFCALYFFFKGVRRGIFGTIVVIVVVVVSLVFSLLTSDYLIADWFTGIGFDDSVFYHLRFGITGAGLGDFSFQILYFVLAQIFTLAIIFLYLRKYLNCHNSQVAIVHVLQGCIMVFCAFACAPATSNLVSYLFTAQIIDDFPEYFVTPKVTITNKKPKNVIYFYLESLEKNYMDENLFPGLLPELHNIEKESVSFTHIGQTIGASWTMAGMVSSQCGLPLLSAFTNKDFRMNNFMPNAVCLGDILKSKGYHLEFMGGAEMEFAGKGLFYKDHGFASIKGKDEFIEAHVGNRYINNWGLYDDTLYQQLLKDVNALRNTQSPWGIFSINIGTHQPEGYLSHQCENVRYGDGSDRLLNAVHCTDLLIGNVYKALKAAGVLEDTIVVFASDHLAPVMVKPYQTLEKGERHNLLMITGAGVKPALNGRQGTTLDVAPTVLNYLQYGSNPIALGRDLNGPLPTLAETFSYQSILDKKLVSWRTVIDMAFWGYPELKKEITIDSRTKLINIGGQSLTFPSVVRYSAEGKIVEVSYRSENPISGGDNRFLPEFYLVNFASNTQLFLWVDRCRVLATISPDLAKFGEQYCYYNGALASIHHASGVLPDGAQTLNITKGADTEVSTTQANALRKALADKNLIEWGQVLLKSIETSSFPFSGVQASGRDSVVRPSNIGGKQIVDSGLYLSRLSYTKDPDVGVSFYVDILGKLPVCDKNQGLVLVDQYIKKSPLKPRAKPLFYSVVGNLEAECKEGIVNPPTDLALRNLNKIAVGNPYIAVMDAQLNIVKEKSAASDKTIAIKVDFNDE